MTGLEYLLLFAVACTVALAVLVVLELMSEPTAPAERFTPLPELLAYEPRHAAPVSPFAAWRTR